MRNGARPASKAGTNGEEPLTVRSRCLPPNMKKKHPADIPHYENMDELVEFIVGKLRYDKGALLARKLADRFWKEAGLEADRGRNKLHCALFNTSLEMYHVAEELEKAWKICEPYTE